MELRIFQKGFNFSQDGPGNRLVYHLQGCNLRCPWCSNPEGLSLQGGMSCSIDEIVAEVLRSRAMFFDGGGVTLTGGEVCMQFSAAAQLLDRLYYEGINTCIETNGTSPRLPELFPSLDLLIMDIKHHDPQKHKEVTGVSCLQTYRNITAALAAKQPLALRIPLIGGFNASVEDAAAFARLLKQLGVPGKATLELLPYHEYGRAKYNSLGMEYRMDENAHVSAAQVAAFAQCLKDEGITLIHT